MIETPQRRRSKPRIQAQPEPRTQSRPRVSGKFLFAGEEKVYVRGVTYGPFHPDANDCLYHDAKTVDRDFALMAKNGINAVRTYTVPPRWLLDSALRHGLWVMVGLPWEQHITFLDDPATAARIEEKVRLAVRSCEAHPAILCFTVGNEIPASIVRWHGRRNIERFLKTLYLACKDEDPSALVTYVNFPPTEYLQLDFLDFVSFNVYLEKPDRLQAYLARLQNLAGFRPLVMAEVGLDSRSNGVYKQAEVLDWQIRSVFANGCAGVFVFAWTDEWSRGGFEIEDWDFGMTTRDRRPKPVLQSVAKAYRETPFPVDVKCPFVSVVICSYNGQRTIAETLAAVLESDYPNYEVIVVNDGSKDDTPSIAATFEDVRLISVENGGLSAARNIGMRAARGEIIAYLDDDAYPDPHWLHYLAAGFVGTPHVAIGGPNIPPRGDGFMAECVANGPGGPTHVLLSDEVAEHIPGCNFAVRRSALEKIGGFDPVYRAAGDDVDACWRLQELGTIGFVPAALVWHHRRNSLRAYWKQQKGYGRAEALLEGKWPLKYNSAGHLAWQGRLYGPGVLRSVGRRWRVYQGTWGSALFQALYEPNPGTIQSLAQMPEWYLLMFSLGVLSGMGFLWAPLFAFLPFFAGSLLLAVAQAVSAASKGEFPSRPSRRSDRLRLIGMTSLLFLLQPLARLQGRFGCGLTPWRRKQQAVSARPATNIRKVWSEQWRPSEEWLERFEAAVLRRASATRGGDYDEWDLHVRGGLAGAVRVYLGIEEHGAGRQLLRWRVRPVFNTPVAVLAIGLLALAAAGAHSRQFLVAALTGMAGILLALWVYRDCSLASGSAFAAVESLEERKQ